MSKIKKIVVVGGGSAGWIVATSLITQLQNTEIVVIESPDIPTVGVGESTVGGIRGWLRMVGIRDLDFMKETDASYKIAIKFNNFYEKDKGTWYYPFGKPFIEENSHKRDDWFIKKALYPETPTHDYVDCYYSQMALVHENKILIDDQNLDNFNFYNDTAFHFDAAKLGLWLREKFTKPRGVNHISANVEKIITNDQGIEKLLLDTEQEITGDLFIDCTGFKSLLIEGALGVPFISYEDLLPNNRAWAIRIPYTNKEKQLNSVTECTALNNGWVWNIPLWSRIGTGYVYSDKYISPENAKKDFINYLTKNGHNLTGCEFKDIKMRIGRHEKLWHKNVVALGLSAAFIEPLESTGLLTTHEFAKTLCSILLRGGTSQWDRDEFNLKCEDEFNYWATFVSMHYALSHRDDSAYWRAIKNRSVTDIFPNLGKLQTQCLFHQSIFQKNFENYFQDDPGINCLAAGMNWTAIDKVVLNHLLPTGTDIQQNFLPMIYRLEQRKKRWREAVKQAPSLYEYLKKFIYKE